MWQLTFVVVDLSLKLLISSLVIAYFETLRLHQFYQNFPGGACPRTPLAQVGLCIVTSLPMHLLCNPLFR